MISRFQTGLFLTMILALSHVAVFGQQPTVPDEAKINQMRTTVQRLEGVLSDPNIPTETKEQLADVLFEKRAELHALLRQKKDALSARLQNHPNDTDSGAIQNTIQMLNAEMRRLRTGALPDVRSGDNQSGVETATDTGQETETSVNQSGNQPQNVPVDSSQSNRPASRSTTAQQPVASTQAPANNQPSADSGQPATNNTQPANNSQPAAQTGPQDSRCQNLPLDNPQNHREHYRALVRRVACRVFLFKTDPARGQILFLQDADLIALGLDQKTERIAIAELTSQAENASNSKQVGASGSSAGSTSLALKAGVPAILGFAVENGALAKDTSGTTVTFSGNPVGLLEALRKKGFIQSFQEQDDFTQFLRKFSFGVSFDTNRGSQPGTFLGDKQQLSGYSLKYNIIDQRDPRSSGNTARWESLTAKQAADLAGAINDFVRQLTPGHAPPELEAWRNSANGALGKAATLDEIQRVLVEYLDKLGAVKLPDDLSTRVKNVATNFDAYLDERNRILGEIANGWLATVEYNNTRPIGSPSLSHFRFLAQKGAYNGSIDFTGNASMSFYNSLPTGPNANRLRDFFFAGQLDVPIGDVTKTGVFLLSFTGRYERLLNDQTIAGTTAVIRKGDVGVFQAKLTVPIRGTAIKIPLSFTVANRTELIKEKEVRGNFGITFDLDSIMAKFNPFTQK